MVRKKKAKATSLILTFLLIGLYLADIPPHLIGIYEGSPIYTRFSYHFFHASWLHLSMNAWCLLSLVFLHNISLRSILAAYLIAASIPILSTLPTIGLSGICFVLMGRISFSVKRKLYYQLWTISFITLGFILPSTNAALHLYCYTVGLLIALLNQPIK